MRSGIRYAILPCSLGRVLVAATARGVCNVRFGNDDPEPLDVRASRFQRRVWDALCAIPRGRTRSYSELAAALGMPRGARAVARACATNPVAVVVPCHRVVARDGGLAGYRWGVERKRALLDREGIQSLEGVEGDCANPSA
jgi:AraC family transcriptional regulator of adaptative response/methylated-DNA-[protein]-cysteine methyltransferase